MSHGRWRQSKRVKQALENMERPEYLRRLEQAFRDVRKPVPVRGIPAKTP